MTGYSFCVGILGTPEGAWQEVTSGGLPGHPVVRTLRFHCQGPLVQSLVRELRSCKPQGTVKKKKVTSGYKTQHGPDSESNAWHLEVLEFEAGHRGDVSRQEEDEGEYAPELACRRGFLAPWRPGN